MTSAKKTKAEKELNITDRSKAPEVHADELTTVAQGAGVTFAGKLSHAVLQNIYAIVIARILGVNFFGLLMLGMTIVNFAGVIGRLGLESGVVRFVSLYNGIGDKRRVKGTVVQSLKYSFAASIVLAVILFLTAEPLLAKLFHKPEMAGIIKALAVSIPFFSLMMIALSSTQGFKKMKYMVYSRNFFWPISNLLLVIIFYSLGFKLYGVIAAHIITVFFAAALSLFFLMKTFPEIKNTESISQNRELFRFSIPLLFVIFLNFIIMWTDTLMLGYFTSSKDVGIYNAAMRIALQTSMILVSFNAIFAPVLSDLYNRKEIQKLKNLYKVVTKWIYSISFPLFLLFLLLSEEILLLFGQEFGAGWLPLVILALAQLINAGVGSAGWILVMSGNQDLVMYNSIGISLLNIYLNYILIPMYGIVGAAIASGLSIAIFNIIMLLEVYLLLKIHPYSRKYIKPTLIGVLSYAILYLLINISPHGLSSIQRLLVFAPLFLAVFVWIMHRWGIDDEDRLVLNGFKKKFQKYAAR